MINGDEWKNKLVPGKKYHIVGRCIDEDMIFVAFGVVGVPEWPVFSSLKGVNRMLDWWGIDQIEPLYGATSFHNVSGVKACLVRNLLNVSWVTTIPFEE